MKRSEHRILTTHSGSIARPDYMLELIQARADGPYDPADYAAGVRRAVADAVQIQVEHRIDIVNDGEQWRTTFSGYIADRLAGFGPATTPPPAQRPWVWARNAPEMEAFPEYFARYYKEPHYTEVVGTDPSKLPPMACIGPVSYTGQEAVQTDIDNLRAALKGVDVEEAFITASGPRLTPNEYYGSRDEYVQAVSDAMREEYTAIVDAGFVLQVDDPGLLRYDPALGAEAGKKVVEGKIEALNYALRGIPEDRIRYHFCYGPALSPKVHDPTLAELLPYVLKVNASAYSFEASNARHVHEYRVFETIRLPEGKILLPGVLSHGSNIVEHPEFIAELTIQYANLVGKENVIVANDCGFSSRALYTPEVEQRVALAKFDAMAEGAKLASDRLFH